MHSNTGFERKKKPQRVQSDRQQVNEQRALIERERQEARKQQRDSRDLVNHYAYLV